MTPPSPMAGRLFALTPTAQILWPGALALLALGAEGETVTGILLGPIAAGAAEALPQAPDAQLGPLAPLPPGRLTTLPGTALTATPGQVARATVADLWRRQLIEQSRDYGDFQFPAPAWTVDTNAPIPPSGKVVGGPEIAAMVDAALDAWLTTGRHNEAFEARLAAFHGPDFRALTANSGSSANLLAFSALTSPHLKERAIRPGDEVITVAASFPTTVNPILLHGAVPVFVDVELGTYNTTAERVAAAITPRTRAIMMAHTLGNPFPAAAIAALAKAHGLWLVEDCCDALGSTLGGQMVGTFGDLATYSFYPAHHITMGEGGAVVGRSRELMVIVESIRDWGRDCHCPPGRDNTCGQRFCHQFPALPYGYDHKYVYAHLGFNLKITDMQAACALAQLDRLPDFIALRQRNFATLNELVAPLEEFFILPQATPGSRPSWFGYPLTLREDAPFSRRDLLVYLDEQRIGSRLLFAGNLVRQPYMAGRTYRVAEPLTQSDRILTDTFWLGLYPALNDAALARTAAALAAFCGVADFD